MLASGGRTIDDSGMAQLLSSYLETVEIIAAEKRWFEGLTAYRFAASHLTVANVSVAPTEVQQLADSLKSALDRVDPLRGYTVPMAGLALSRSLGGPLALARLDAALESIAALPRAPGRTDRSRAVPMLAFGGPVPSIITADLLASLHAAWDRRHRWMTTGRHYSFAAIGAVAALDPETLAERADLLHDLLGAGRYWHEWDASILLSFHPDGADEARQRYESAVAGFTGGGRRPPPVARDDLAVVAMADGDPGGAGLELREAYEHLRMVRPRPSNQVAMAVSAGLVLAGRSPSEGWQRKLVDGFLMYGYAEALTEEASS